MELLYLKIVPLQLVAYIFFSLRHYVIYLFMWNVSELKIGLIISEIFSLSNTCAEEQRMEWGRLVLGAFMNNK